jgi:hypothetical protein
MADSGARNDERFVIGFAFDLYVRRQEEGD